jgi:hypothetical protein
MTEEGNTGLTWEHRLALWLPRPLLLGAFLVAMCISAAYQSFQWFLDLRVEQYWTTALTIFGRSK